MKKALTGIALFVLVGLGLAVIFRDTLQGMVDDRLTRDMFVPAVAADPLLGPERGSTLPVLQASRMGRPVTHLENYARGNGTVLIVLRSIDWCIYCKRQIRQLQDYQHHFQAAGIGLVAITYDAPEVQQPFIDQHAITIPVLSDHSQGSFRALGVINENYKPGDAEYGIPHPGLIVVDREGVIVGKLFVASHELRVDSSEALRYARDALGIKTPFG